jgi:hypothetical protein
MAFRNFDASFHLAVSSRVYCQRSAQICEIIHPVARLVNQHLREPCEGRRGALIE